MPIGAVISGAASIGGALIGSSASSKASAQQVAAQREALAQQKEMFGVAKGALSPYYTAGTGVLPTLQALITPGTSAATLATMPGFKFQSEYGTNAAMNALAARGLVGSPGPLSRAVSDYNTGLAGTYWKDAVNALQGFAGMGSSAASALGGVAGNFSAQIGQTMGNIGNAQAAGTLGSANALAGGLTGGANSVTNAMLMNRLLPGAGGSGSIYGANFAETSSPFSFGAGGYAGMGPFLP